MCPLIGALLLTLAGVFPQTIDEAEKLAWAKQFAESEAMYRRILEREPTSRAARLGLARVVLWQGRYDEAKRRFDELLREKADDADALEGRGLAAYWSGDLRGAVRDLRRVSDRESARRSLVEIASISAPSQRIAVDALHDDQPLDGVRAEGSATFFSDPLTRWTASAGGYRIENRGGELASIGNETVWGRFVFGGSIGLFEFPDGAIRPIGGAMVRHREITLRIDRREELAAATALRTHAASTTTTLRWNRDTPRWTAAAEASDRRYFDGNRGNAFVAYAVAPIERSGWTIWGGASVTARDTKETRFRMTATSSTLDPSGTFFHYTYRGEYDPYWTPDDLREGRIVVAVEKAFARGTIKLHGDGGWARDRGYAFGPDSGLGPFPTNVQAFPFRRRYHPWRAGITGHFALGSGLRLEIGAERGATVDYRSNTFHAAVVRRR